MRKLFFAFLAFCVISACDEEPTNDSLLLEKTIDLSGNWNISNVYQNGVEITDSFDFSTFKLRLNYQNEAPSSFSITSEVETPFVSPVNAGNWTFDNAVYPSKIFFADGATTYISDFAEPLSPSVNDSFSILFSLGCAENEYVYHLSKN
ncbi:MAG: hypothetical protein ACI9A7_000864 [Cyclobacteriaceae bacterium]|jgi:hypothetical protein